MKDYKGRQLARLGAVILMLFLIAGIINAGSIFYGSMYRFRQRQKEAVIHIMDDLDRGIFLFKHNYFWFMNFFHENYRDFKIDTKPFEDMLNDATAIANKHDYEIALAIPAEVLDSLPYDEQLTIAEQVYCSNNNSYNLDLTEYGMEVGSLVRLLIPEENNQAFVVYETDPVFARKKDRDVWVDKPVFGLGKIIQFDLNEHPNALKAYTTGEKQLEPEEMYSFADRKMVSNYYIPVKDDGKVVALIQMSIDWSENLRVIWQNAWQVELINMLVLVVVAAIIMYLVKMLTERVMTLSGEQERKNTELSIARNIQKQNLPNTFPAFPDRKDFDIYASMDAFHEVGGDFYDYFLIDDDHIALVIADVSDKGVPAALFMMMAKAKINSLTKSAKTLSPSLILSEVNESLCENNDSVMFVTVWLGILTLSTGELVTANGGHLDPIISKEGKFSIYEEDHGLLLGAVKNQQYEDNRWKLEKGDVVFVCTDGAIEAMDENDQEFGYERLLDVLNRNQEKDLSDMLKAAKTAVDEYSGEAGRFDDITMLALRLT